MDPIIGSLVATLGGSLLKDIFNPGPSQAQIQAQLAAQQAAANQKLLIYGGLAAAGLIAILLITRR